MKNSTNPSVNNSTLKRFAAIAQEAEFTGNYRLASSLTRVIDKNAESVRSDSDPYTYNKETFRQDVDDALWNTMVRFADFYQVPLKELAVQAMVDEMAEQLEAEFCRQHEVFKGANEDQLPGEHFEVEETE